LFGPAANGLNIDIYPYETEESYVKALVKYSPSAVANREKINGYAMDSEVTTVGG
jgi:hypothetical protein